jgi:hypothetical protein
MWVGWGGGGGIMSGWGEPVIVKRPTLSHSGGVLTRTGSLQSLCEVFGRPGGGSFMHQMRVCLGEGRGATK